MFVSEYSEHVSLPVIESTSIFRFVFYWFIGIWSILGRMIVSKNSGRVIFAVIESK